MVPRMASHAHSSRCPHAVWADLSGPTILQTGSTLNLNTGAVASSGGDILWNGSTIAPQGAAKLSNAGTLPARLRRRHR
jgi:hypothetical protein